MSQASGGLSRLPAPRRRGVAQWPEVSASRQPCLHLAGAAAPVLGRHMAGARAEGAAHRGRASAAAPMLGPRAGACCSRQSPPRDRVCAGAVLYTGSRCRGRARHGRIPYRGRVSCLRRRGRRALMLAEARLRWTAPEAAALWMRAVCPARAWPWPHARAGPLPRRAD